MPTPPAGRNNMIDEQIESDDQKLDIMDMTRGILHSCKHFLILGVLLSGVLAGFFCFRIWRNYIPRYQAGASFRVQVVNPLHAQQQQYNIMVAEQLAKTFPHILGSSVLQYRVMEKLQIPDMPEMNVSVLGRTNIISLNVIADDPKLAYDVLNCVIEVYPSVAEFVVGPTTLSMISESGIPQTPVNSRNYRSAVGKGAALGVLIWMVASLLYWLTHQTINHEDELGRLVNLPCLGRLPTVRGCGRGKAQKRFPVITGKTDKSGFHEAIRLLRFRVEREMDRHSSQVLVVTSTIADEGKTTISVNLAAALAQKGKRVLLIDCDLRNPSVASALGRVAHCGFGEFLTGKCTLNQILHHENGSSLYTIYGGKPVGRPECMLSGDMVRNFMDAARRSFDYIVLDTPPCSLVADTAQMMSLADCVLLSVRQNFACRQQIVEGVQILAECGKPIIGCVMNMYTPIGGRGCYNNHGYYGVSRIREEKNS